VLLAEMGLNSSKTYWLNPDYFGQLAANAASLASGASNGPAERRALIDRTLAYLEAVCPAADAPSRVLIERANRLLELAAHGE
jgi:hypothetical protein